MKGNCQLSHVHHVEGHSHFRKKKGLLWGKITDLIHCDNKLNFMQNY